MGATGLGAAGVGFLVSPRRVPRGFLFRGHQGSARPPRGPSRVALSKGQAKGAPRCHPQSGTALSCGTALVTWLVAPRRGARVATTTLFDFRMLRWFCLRPLETFPWSEGSVFSKQRPGQA